MLYKMKYQNEHFKQNKDLFVTDIDIFLYFIPKVKQSVQENNKLFDIERDIVILRN